ncbi:MAG: hypothetical protein WC538_22160 [Thermoanaerobaculia bacterium]|jgi:hypothetical protein
MTTLTVYPDSGQAGTSTDDAVRVVNAADWATARAASSGSAFTNASEFYFGVSGASPGTWTLWRCFLHFDTSSLPDGATISDAVLSLSRGGTNAQNETTYRSNPQVVASTAASNNAIVDGDFDQVGSAAFCDSPPTLATYAASSGYKDFTLNAAGKAAINKTGVTKLAVRATNDLNDTAPSANSYGAVIAAENSGTTNDPKLVITYTEASAFVPKIIIS